MVRVKDNFSQAPPFRILFSRLIVNSNFLNSGTKFAVPYYAELVNILYIITILAKMGCVISFTYTYIHLFYHVL